MKPEEVELLERLKKKYEDDRRKGIEAVEAKYAKLIEALELVLSQGQDHEAVPTPGLRLKKPPRRQRFARGKLDQKVRAIVVQLTGEFDFADVQKKILENDPDLSEDDLKRGSLTGILKRLAEEGLIKTIWEGKGRKSSRYSRAEKKLQERTILAPEPRK